MAHNYCTQDAPPPAGPQIWVKRLKANEKWACVICSSKITGLWIHWFPNQRKTEPCWQERQRCPGCKSKVVRKWKGYLHVLHPSSKKQWFLELTPWSAQAILNQLEPGYDLRGLRLDLQRGDGDKARMVVNVKPPFPGQGEVPLEKYVVETLEQLWRLQGIDLQIYDPDDVENNEAM